MLCYNCRSVDILRQRKKFIALSVGRFSKVFCVSTNYCKACDIDYFQAPEVVEANQTLARLILNSMIALTGEEFKFARKYVMTKHKDIWDLLGYSPFAGINLENKKNEEMPEGITNKLREIAKL